MTIYFFLQVAGMFLIPLAAVIIPLFIGQRYGIIYSKTQADIPYNSISSAVSAAFGLLAFMLAFTFQIAANRYETRKLILVEEVKNIRTAYLRAGLIPEPFCSNTKKYLLDYVNLRVNVVKDYSTLDEALGRSPVILDTLWKYTEALAVQDRGSEVYALYITAINDIIDAYYKRITTVLVYRIPPAVLWVLFILLFLTMLGLGYQFGVSGKGSFGINLLLAVIFAVVMFLISALDNPERGLVRLNQKPILNLQKQLNEKQSNIRTTDP